MVCACGLTLHREMGDPASSCFAKGDYRIDFRRPARGKITRKRSDTDEKESDTGKGQRIGGPHSVKQSRDETRHDQRRRKPDDGSGQSEAKALPQNQIQDAGSGCAESETNSNLVRAFAHEERNHAVNSQRREKQGGQREERNDFHQESSLG